MVQIAGKYKLEKNENFAEYLKAIGIPDEIAKKAEAPGLTTEVFVEGNKYNINSSSGVNSSIPLDQEFEEQIPGSQAMLKSKAKKVGDVITVTSTAPDGRTGERKYEFSDKGYVVSFTSGNVTGKRYFTRI